MKPRVCAGCGKSKSVWGIDRAYWHLGCFKKAKPEARKAAAEAQIAEQREAMARADQLWKERQA